MRTALTLALSLSAFAIQAQTISTLNNNTFSPNLVTVEQGESVTFVVTGNHTATQVSEATWNANGNTPLSGGFNYGSGTHEYTPTLPGVIYFVCIPHASLGMKGRIVVEVSSGVTDVQMEPLFRIFPNPASDELMVDGGSGELSFIDVQGREVMRRSVTQGDRTDISRLMEGNYTVLLHGTDGAVLARQRLTVAR
jgi:plastocyanin